MSDEELQRASDLLRWQEINAVLKSDAIFICQSAPAMRQESPCNLSSEQFFDS
jgi:hypothetical protein